MRTKQRNKLNINNLNNIQQIQHEYTNDNSIFNEDCQRVKQIKYIIENYLSPNERILFILYLECNFRVRDFCKIVGCELTTARNYIWAVKKKIRNKYNELFSND